MDKLYDIASLLHAAAQPRPGRLILQTRSGWVRSFSNARPGQADLLT